MTTFFLVRHGTRVDRSEDTELSELGQKQAELTARYVAKQNITGIYASPMKRAQQTAQAIAEHIQLPVITDARLLERMIYDGRAGDTFEEFLDEWDKTMGDRNYQPTYGDTAFAAGERLKALLDELPENGKYVIVSHGGIIGDVLRNLFTDAPLKFQTDSAKSLQWVVIGECSISEITRENNTYTLIRANDTRHLTE